MRLDPITYSQRYNDESGEKEVARGFKPFKNEKGERILERKVVVETANWKYGFMIIFRFMEDYFTSTSVKGEWLLGGERRTRELQHQCIYDNPVQGSLQKPMSMQNQLLLAALASGELRGKYAESIAHELFLELMVDDKNPDSLMRKFLPDVVDFWINFRKQCEEDERKRNERNSAMGKRVAATNQK